MTAPSLILTQPSNLDTSRTPVIQVTDLCKSYQMGTGWR